MTQSPTHPAAASTPAPCLYAHDAHSILPVLAAHLPHSITVFRRLQHGLAYPSSTAKILATFPPGVTPTATATPWLAARVDLFRGRETQMLIYSSLEAEHTSIDPISPVAQCNGAATTTPGPDTISYYAATFATATPAALDTVRAQLLALLAHVKTHLLPEYLSSLPAAPSAEAPSAMAPALSSPPSSSSLLTSSSSSSSPSSSPKSSDVALIPPPDPHAFLIGALHTALYTLLTCSSSFPSPNQPFNPLPGLRIHRIDNPPTTNFSSPVPRYRYHNNAGLLGVQPAHLDLVQSRTHIPRSRAQLSTMPSVAVYCDAESGTEEAPIAWAFLGMDGAVATLFVEPAHRGRGLALSLSRETMRCGMDAEGVFGDVGVQGASGADWVHTEVAQNNRASARVMEKIGGEVLSTVMWTVVEVL
ncbi:Acyl-CoA N-acyltransferase [Penicillium macrosclerotiorum]|uniref:Acyl-CoA N-acyltransferase n=1 Tax=Penicillium macrosclerotiorum TaxID=303699 RepID=UPI0025471BF2|nr:Acyl-CoA N-acyltransferase [Penicillium macrosclerotiorum]KAJ5692234.1 Acyl-CoA N-acyltransferase [Penicillium macrosclerotiorum]